MKDEHTAKALGKDLPISTKQSIEIGNFIRGKSVTRAKVMLEGVIAKKVAVPMKRFNRDTGHKRGNIAAGRYPEKASKHILAILKSAEMNAQNKGLNTDELFIKLLMANTGSSQWRYGRQRRRQAKRTNVEIVLEEREVKEKKPAAKKEAPKKKPKETLKVEKPKEAPKKEAPKVEKKEAPKEEKKPGPKKEEKKDAPKEKESPKEEK